jgi:phospholipid transport system substrate-binding protein
MTVRRRLVATTIALVLALVAGREAFAGAPADQLKEQISRVIRVLDDPDLAKDGKGRERRAAVRRVAEEMLDLREMTQRSVGRHWQGLSASQRDELVKLFGDLLERSYVSKLETYGGEKVQVLGDAIDGEHATVKSKIVTKGGTEIPVDYRMQKRSERWLAYDVAIEGVSLVANYRSQFNRILQAGGYPELVKKLKQKEDEQLKRTSQR